jgi:hypothetical protein
MKRTAEIEAARIEAERARAEFIESLRALEAPLLELKRQLTPRHIMSEVWQEAKGKGADLAEDAVDAVRSRPFAATGAVAALAMFLAREPLIDLAGKLIGGAPKKRGGSSRRKPKATRTDTEKSNDPE